ncbi:MAG: D-alanyl-D-alanine carboxypeptidase/D-alanyl-D-alanine-endopeptidase [Nitrospinota bacterium]|nr:MAG: D-alanyl-D-alanine carboxypeptidase/D-alanyl-D-alanine-endopeptidase [Nitrospinota bacterium]
MRRIGLSLLLFLLGCLLFSSQGLAGSPPKKEENRLQAAIRRISNTPCLRQGKVGVKVVSLSRQETLVAINADQHFIPASNTKLFTTAVALLRLHPEYTFATPLFTDGKLVGDRLEGNLYLQGSGDPSLVSEELWIMVEQLWNQGIRAIKGDIVGDDRFFTGAERGRGWTNPRSVRAYNAKTGALSLNFNAIAVRVEPGRRKGEKVRVTLSPPTAYITLTSRATTSPAGSRTAITVDRRPLPQGDRIVVAGRMAAGEGPQTFYRNISHPTLFTLTVLREFLERYGIAVQGGVREGEVPPEATRLLTHHSKPLARILLDMNKFSNNFIAEQVLKTLGAEIKGPPGSFQKGLDVLEETLAELGIAPRTYTLADGSGLSPLNRVTPAQIVHLLEQMYNRFTVQAEFLASLGIMGVDGSVKERLEQTPAQRRVRVKTGSLAGVSALSGYVETLQGELLAFSILMNRFACGLFQAMDLQDEMVLQMVRFAR